MIATVLAVAAGAAIWLLVGPWWLLAAATGYLLLLVAVRLTFGRRSGVSPTHDTHKR